MTARRPVPLQEFTCLVRDFPLHLQLAPSTAPVPIGLVPLRFPVHQLHDALDAQLGGCDPGNNVRAVLLHYGLDAQDVLALALQCVCLAPEPGQPDTYTYEPTDIYYRVENDSLVLQEDPFSDWDNDLGERYRSSVVVRRTDGPEWNEFDPALDVHSTLFPYDGELDLLILDNDLEADALLELVPGAEPRRWQPDGQGGIVAEGWHAVLCWVPVGVALDNTAHPLPYTRKGADLGATRPPFTSPVELHTTGLPRRPGC